MLALGVFSSGLSPPERDLLTIAPQTIFSMSMFNWQASGSQIVTHNFWIYWAISVPLAVLLVVLWLLWWTWQKNEYDKSYRSAASSGSLAIVTSNDKVKNL